MNEPSPAVDHERRQPVGELIELRRVVEQSQPLVNQVAEDAW